MTSQIKKLVIFVVIGVVIVTLYMVFIKKDEEADLTSSAGLPVLESDEIASQNSQIAQDFLELLLSVKGIRLDDSIFRDPAFASLRDSSIELIPDGTEGRPNPFAPIGNDAVATPVASPSSSATPTSTSTSAPATSTGTSTPAQATTTTTTTVQTTPTPEPEQQPDTSYDQ